MGTSVSKMNLGTLIKNWPIAEYDILIETASQESPDVNWGKAEKFFIALGKQKYFYKRI